MKYFNIMGDSLKNPIFRIGGSRKSNIQGELLKKRGGWTVFRFKGRGGMAKKRRGGVVDTLMHTMNLPNDSMLAQVLKELS